MIVCRIENEYETDPWCIFMILSHRKKWYIFISIGLENWRIYKPFDSAIFVYKIFFISERNYKLSEVFMNHRLPHLYINC